MKKTLRLISLMAVLMLVTFSANAQIYADFTGTETVKLQHLYNDYFLCYEISSMTPMARPESAEYSNEWTITPNISNPGWYNIISKDGNYYYNSGVGDAFANFIRPIAYGDLDQSCFRFQEDQEVNGNPAVPNTFNMERIADNAFVNVKSATDPDKQYDLGKGATPNSTDKYRWRIIVNGDVVTDISEAKTVTNYVYPVAGNEGVFKLMESTKWTAYSISGTVVASGNGYNIDLSAFSKGLYIIKYDGLTKKVKR